MTTNDFNKIVPDKNEFQLFLEKVSTYSFGAFGIGVICSVIALIDIFDLIGPNKLYYVLTALSFAVAFISLSILWIMDFIKIKRCERIVKELSLSEAEILVERLKSSLSNPSGASSVNNLIEPMRKKAEKEKSDNEAYLKFYKDCRFRNVSSESEIKLLSQKYDNIISNDPNYAYKQGKILCEKEDEENSQKAKQAALEEISRRKSEESKQRSIALISGNVKYLRYLNNLQTLIDDTKKELEEREKAVESANALASSPGGGRYITADTFTMKHYDNRTALGAIANQAEKQRYENEQKAISESRDFYYNQANKLRERAYEYRKHLNNLEHEYKRIKALIIDTDRSINDLSEYILIDCVPNKNECTLTVNVKQKPGVVLLGKSADIDGSYKISVSINGRSFGTGYLYGNYRETVKFKDDNRAQNTDLKDVDPYKIGFNSENVVKLCELPENSNELWKNNFSSITINVEAMNLWVVGE